jgi:hypothetical protein
VPTQRHFHQGRKPAQSIVWAVRHQERRLRQIVLGGYRLHHLVHGKRIEYDHRGGVAAEAMRSEGIELEHNGHT